MPIQVHLIWEWDNISLNMAGLNVSCSFSIETLSSLKREKLTTVKKKSNGQLRVLKNTGGNKILEQQIRPTQYY